MPLRRTLEMTASQCQDLQHYRDLDLHPYVREYLQHAPVEEAELAPTPDGPAPSRWALRGVRATFP